ncbi:MAG TPA: ABC transporter substrate-binding protein, partial [Gemmatimonadaceae bacterium]|nr:ABC transporter substrate-binding protein [Gemmatimonadaceae bacterium]
MRRLVPALFLALAACGDASSRAPLGGTVVVAAAADADALLPPLVRTSQGRLASELLFDRLVEIGPSLNTVGDADFQPRLATRWSWSDDSLAISFDLDPDARWHDGQPLRA